MKQRLLLCVALAASMLLSGAASAVVVIEDFSNAAVASYTGYSGPRITTGVTLTGWEFGGRYLKIEDVGGDKMMSGTQDGAGYDVGISLGSSNEKTPVWVAAQSSEAVSLANADSLQFQLVNRFAIAGLPNETIGVNMYYYDTTDAVTRTVTLINGLKGFAGNWALGETKTLEVDVDTISGFDKAADLVYGFRMWGGWNRMASTTTYGAIGLTSIAYTEVPEPATLVLLTLGGLAMLRRRS